MINGVNKHLTECHWLILFMLKEVVNIKNGINYINTDGKFGILALSCTQLLLHNKYKLLYKNPFINIK